MAIVEHARKFDRIRTEVLDVLVVGPQRDQLLTVSLETHAEVDDDGRVVASDTYAVITLDGRPVRLVAAELAMFRDELGEALARLPL